jgi:hypothetical protein
MLRLFIPQFIAVLWLSDWNNDETRYYSTKLRIIYASDWLQSITGKSEEINLIWKLESIGSKWRSAYMRSTRCTDSVIWSKVNESRSQWEASNKRSLRHTMCLFKSLWGSKFDQEQEFEHTESENMSALWFTDQHPCYSLSASTKHSEWTQRRRNTYVYT